MRWAYIREIWDFGSTMEIEEKHTGRYGARGQEREEKKKATPEEIAKQNQWRRERDVRRLIKWNFSSGDYWMTLTYKKGERPAWEQMKKDLAKLIRKVRLKYKKKGWELKYIYRLAIGKKGGPHVHLLVNREADQETGTDAVVEEASECEKLDRDALDAAVDAGKLVLFYDGEKVKVARGVNSLTTVSKGKADPWKKIRVVETMDMMHDDLVLLAEDNYVGKYPNTYSNKCLLISAIDSYMKELERNGLIQDYAVELDVEKIKEYIIENKGVTRDEAEAMSDEEIKKQYTDEKVFMKASVTIVDVMEDINLEIAV